jgi:hypothetical protein
MHSIIAFIDEDRDRCIGCCVGNGHRHSFHDNRVADNKSKYPGTLSSLFLSQDFAGVKADKFHQIGRSGCAFYKYFQFGNCVYGVKRFMELVHIRAPYCRSEPLYGLLE